MRAILISAAAAMMAGGQGAALAQTPSPPAAAVNPKVVAMVSPDGQSRGTVKLTSTSQGVLLEAELTGLPDGPHAFHVHQKGVCAGDFTSAGGHYNPGNHAHGYMAEGGPHAGDMPNIVVTGGKASFSTFNPMVRLTSGTAPLNDVDGSAIIVHAGVDDYHSQPTGDAGGRIACGVVFPPAPPKQ